LGDILVTAAQCAGKYITYTRNLAARYLHMRYARRQAVARQTKKILRTNIHRQTDRQSGTELLRITAV